MRRLDLQRLLSIPCRSVSFCVFHCCRHNVRHWIYPTEVPERAYQLTMIQTALLHNTLVRSCCSIVAALCLSAQNETSFHAQAAYCHVTLKSAHLTHCVPTDLTQCGCTCVGGAAHWAGQDAHCGRRHVQLLPLVPQGTAARLLQTPLPIETIGTQNIV